MWSEEEKNVLLNLKKHCLVHMFLQSSSAYISSTIQSIITIPNIIIGGVLSVTIFSTDSYTWKISTGVLAVLSTILSSLQKQLAAGERAQVHVAAVRQYQILVRDINIHLSFSMGQQEKIDFIREVKSEMDKIFTIQPEASMFAIKFFQNRYHTRIEDALFDDFEKMVLGNAEVVERMTRFPRMTNRYSTVHLFEQRLPSSNIEPNNPPAKDLAKKESVHKETRRRSFYLQSVATDSDVYTNATPSHRPPPILDNYVVPPNAPPLASTSSDTSSSQIQSII